MHHAEQRVYEQRHQQYHDGRCRAQCDAAFRERRCGLAVKSDEQRAQERPWQKNDGRMKDEIRRVDVPENVRQLISEHEVGVRQQRHGNRNKQGHADFAGFRAFFRCGGESGEQDCTWFEETFQLHERLYEPAGDPVPHDLEWVPHVILAVDQLAMQHQQGGLGQCRGQCVFQIV